MAITTYHARDWIGYGQPIAPATLPTQLFRYYESNGSRIIQIGAGNATLSRVATNIVALDCDDRINFMLAGATKMKFQNHPQAGPLLAMQCKLWFLNTLLADAQFLYEGLSFAGDGTGFRMLVQGQNVNGPGVMRGGVLELAAGSGDGAGSDKRGGWTLLRGGLTGAAVSGNVCIHGEPANATTTGFGGGSRVIFIADAAAEPTAAPVGGAFLWSFGGVLKGMGVSGVPTALAA
jgi:hypothetical protein